LEWSFSTSSALELSLTITSASEWSFATSAALKLSQTSGLSPPPLPWSCLWTISSALELSIATTSAMQMDEKLGQGFKTKKKKK